MFLEILILDVLYLPSASLVISLFCNYNTEDGKSLHSQLDIKAVFQVEVVYSVRFFSVNEVFLYSEFIFC